MSPIMIDAAKCVQDGICADVCPRKLIRLDTETDRPVPSPEAEALCIACGQCLAACPTGAVTLGPYRPEDCLPVGDTRRPTFTQLDHLIRSRRSHRVYRDTPVDRSVVVTLLDTCRYAPSGSNTQPVRWKLVAGQSRLKELAQLVVDWMKTARLSWTTAERDRMNPIIDAWERGEDRIFRDAPLLVVNHAARVGSLPLENCIIALAQFELAAAASGLGTCWLGFLMLAARAYPPIDEWLNIPRDHQLGGAMIVGYPATTYYRVPPRHPAEIDWL